MNKIQALKAKERKERYTLIIRKYNGKSIIKYYDYVPLNNAIDNCMNPETKSSAIIDRLNNPHCIVYMGNGVKKESEITPSIDTLRLSHEVV